MNRLSVAIALPSYDRVMPAFSCDLARLYRFSFDVHCTLYPITGTYVEAARWWIAKQVLRDRTSHVLWIDSDMRFPCDALQRLLAHDQPVVGVNYRARKPPHYFTALGLDGQRLPTRMCDAGLEMVAGLGFGLVLTRTEVLAETLRRQGAPLFLNQWDEGVQDFRGEDYYFCGKARAAGYQLHVDHSLSRECAHIGEQEYGVEHEVELTSSQAVNA